MMNGKARDFTLHMIKSILFLNLQLFSVFYLATNTNGTILEVYIIIYLALSKPPYFLLYILWKLLKGLQKHISFLKSS